MISLRMVLVRNREFKTFVVSTLRALGGGTSLQYKLVGCMVVAEKLCASSAHNYEAGLNTGCSLYQGKVSGNYWIKYYFI